MRNHHIAELLAILSIVVIYTETRSNVHNILEEKWLPSSDVFEISANYSSESVFVYIGALLCTVPFKRDILSSLITAYRVVGDAINECTLHSR